jgi:hypothetical protein
MLIVDVSEVKLPGKAKQNNLSPECGQPIGGVNHLPGCKMLKIRRGMVDFNLTCMISARRSGLVGYLYQSMAIGVSLKFPQISI